MSFLLCVVVCKIEYYQNLIVKFKKINFKLNNDVLFKGVSTGYALYPNEANDIDQLIYLADQRMYQNKQRKISKKIASK